jgi:undecaprenyl pyrophosphate synthase
LSADSTVSKRHNTSKKVTNKKITLSFLSNSNAGKFILIDTCRDIARKIQNKDITVQDIDKNLIAEELKSNHKQL